MSSRSDFISEYFPTGIAREFFNFMCGEYLGGGVARHVFTYLPDPTCVIKIEHRAQSFQNAAEWDLWQQHNFAKTDTRKWLAPCVKISDCGSMLVMKRTKPVPFTLKLPKRLPNVLCCDLKRENWGMLKGKLVCHDYGRHDAIFYASQTRRSGNTDVAHWIGTENGRFKPMIGDDVPTGVVI